jgi:replicative DNA helicase
MKNWKSQKDAYQESLKYIKGRQAGTITSLLTPWVKVNDATTNGLEWHSMTVIGGRPGSGKTLVKDQIIRESYKLNPAENFRTLEFSLEMLGKNSAIRGYSAHLNRSYKYLCSADGKLTDEDFEKCVSYAREMVKYPIDIVEDAPTVSQLKLIVHNYMKQHSSLKIVKTNDGDDITVTKYKNTVITLDHSLLVKKEKGQSVNDMLFELGEAITELKRRYPIAWIILSQLNRSIDHPDRNEDGKYGNYILDSDIFGADALLQHADTVIGLNRPAKQKIRFYGPERYIIEGLRVLVMHFVKCRNGEGGLAFFEAAFESMSINDAETPPTMDTGR